VTVAALSALGGVVAATLVAGAALRPTRSPRVERSDDGGAGAPDRPMLLVRPSLLGSGRDVSAPLAVAAWFDELGRALRSGETLHHTLATVEPADSRLRASTAPMRLALERSDGVADAVGRIDAAGPHLDLAVAVLTASARVGGSGAAAIDRAAAALRRRAADAAERRAQSSQARLSAHVMTAVPLLMLLSLLVTDADVRDVVASPLGLALLVSGLLLNATGWLWMRRVVGRRG
jgi:tight adherence protein B